MTSEGQIDLEGGLFLSREACTYWVRFLGEETVSLLTPRHGTQLDKLLSMMTAHRGVRFLPPRSVTKVTPLLGPPRSLSKVVEI